ncbi:MAG TPA: efflux RND transporter permease subunit, partial [Pseudomonas sp.]|nr:efflux RND transporter permease subunit [Pseudomonas sp.]
MPNFFIDRPIFAWVIALVVMLAGGLGLLQLPVSQYPSIAAPSVNISLVYPGASAQTVQDTVIQVIEQQMSGLDGMRYMSSESNNDGSGSIKITFEQGTDPNIAQVQVQNKLQLATPLLPMEVQQQGIRVTKAAGGFLMVVALVSSDGRYSNIDLSDYVISNIQDPISRTPGVGDFTVFGSSYSMRIWLDPAKLVSYALTPMDVSNAIRAQNVQVSTGQLGGLPAMPGQQLTATIIGKTRLETPEQFRNILLKVNQDGSQVRLQDVARVEMGAMRSNIAAKYNGMPATGIAITLATGANALATAEAVRDTISRLEPFLPEGMDVVYPFDTTPVISASISSVVMTLFEAIALVFLVMYLFLQNFRATLIPTLAVPVVLLGTFGVLYLFGYSINTLTMFAMVLAIGLLVDDAIVVVENVERVMVEEGLPPREATRKSMGQIQGALVGIGIVLSAVFVPMAFMAGSVGVIYRQFAITIASAMGLSVLVALMFTPALCATLLKPIAKGHHEEKRGFFGWFNRKFESGVHRYEGGVQRVLRNRWSFLGIWVAIVVAVGVLFLRVPAAFLPPEDQGVMFVQVVAPVGATFERTEKMVDELRQYLLTEESDAVKSVMSVQGFSFAGRGQNAAVMFVGLKDWALRPEAKDAVFALQQRAQMRFFQYRDAMAFAIVPPSVIELGNASGFDVYLQDMGGVGHEALMNARNQLLGMAAQHPALAGVRPNGLNDEPQYQILIDDEKAQVLGLSMTDINNTLSIAWGSAYVNDFIDRGRVKKVFMQGEAHSRMNPEDLDKWYIRNNKGEMVPFSAFATGTWTYGSPK